jgi:dGTPase
LIINQWVMDVIIETKKNIQKTGLRSVTDLQKIKTSVVSFSDDMKRAHAQLKKFLHKNLYQHSHVTEMTDQGRLFIKSLFKVYLERPELLIEEITKKSREEGLHRVVCDYLAGMTDRFAIDEYKRLIGEHGPTSR